MDFETGVWLKPIQIAKFTEANDISAPNDGAL